SPSLFLSKRPPGRAVVQFRCDEAADRAARGRVTERGWRRRGRPSGNGGGRALEFARRAALARIVGVEDRQIAEVAVVQESVRFGAVFTCPCGPGRSLVRIVALWSGAAQSRLSAAGRRPRGAGVHGRFEPRSQSPTCW